MASQEIKDGWGAVLPPDDEATGDAELSSSSAPSEGQADDGYEVGYKKPPKHTRWPKGKSGNPKGPQKKDGSVRARVQAVLNRIVTTTGGQSIVFSEGLIQTAVQGLAGKGPRSVKSSIEIINFLERFDIEVGFVPTPADEQRLNELLRQLPKAGGGDEEE